MKRLLILHPSKSFADKLQEGFYSDFQTQWLGDGGQALEMLNSFCPEILILHLSMPRKDGLTILKQMDHRPEIILATTDYLDAFVAHKAHQLGACQVLLMPMVSTVTQWIYDLLAESRFFIREEPVAWILHSLGFRPSLTGYRWLCMALECLKKDPRQNLSGVYQDLGKGAAVEKAIRTAIHQAWKEGHRQVWKKYFGTDTCPGNKTFLLTLLQPDLHRLADDHGAFGDGAIHGQNLHTGSGGFP